mgnify:CR=1 FL=1
MFERLLDVGEVELAAACRRCRRAVPGVHAPLTSDAQRCVGPDGLAHRARERDVGDCRSAPDLELLERALKPRDGEPRVTSAHLGGDPPMNR